MEPSQEEYYLSVAYKYLKNEKWFDITNKQMNENLKNIVNDLVYQTYPQYDKIDESFDIDKEISKIANYKEKIIQEVPIYSPEKIENILRNNVKIITEEDTYGDNSNIVVFDRKKFLQELKKNTIFPRNEEQVLQTLQEYADNFPLEFYDEPITKDSIDYIVNELTFMYYLESKETPSQDFKTYDKDIKNYYFLVLEPFLLADHDLTHYLPLKTLEKTLNYINSNAFEASFHHPITLDSIKDKLSNAIQFKELTELNQLKNDINFTNLEDLRFFNPEDCQSTTVKNVVQFLQTHSFLIENIRKGEIDTYISIPNGDNHLFLTFDKKEQQFSLTDTLTGKEIETKIANHIKDVDPLKNVGC